MNLIQQLRETGAISKEQAAVLEQEIKKSGRAAEDLILEKELVAEKQLFSLKSENLKIPLKKIMAEEVPLKILELIPEESAKYYHMIPLARAKGTLEVGMVYPENLKCQEALKFLSRQGKFKYRVYLITLSDFHDLLKQYRTLKREVGRALEELEVELKEEGVETRRRPAEFERMAEEAPITKVVAVILRHAVDGQASDIHIEPTREKTRVRFRMDGILHSSLFLPLRIHPAVIARIKILSNLRLDEARIPQDGRFSAKIDDKVIDFRVSTFPTSLGEKAALRVLDPSMGMKKLEDLGLEERNLKLVKKAAQKPFGMVLVSGPTGSGKTTTLYAVLDLLNKERVNIMTLEDPVEYFMGGINQSQIRPEIGYTFSTGLRHILRQDPDVIMVGEIRDEESAALAVHAALTGHLMFSTVHTNNVSGIVPRLIDLKVEPFLIPTSLSLGIAQRLVRRLCPHCKKKAGVSPKIKAMVQKELSKLPPGLRPAKQFTLWQAQGCKKCGSSGYSGRIALFEALEMTSVLSDIILKEPSEAAIAAEARRQGMVTMMQDGILKALRGVTSIEEILRVAQEL